MKHTHFGWAAGILGLLCFVMFSANADEALIVVDDEDSINDLLPNLTNGQGIASLETNDVYEDDADGKAALKIEVVGGDGQKFNPHIPGWAFQVVQNPSAGNEFRYITFAWKKVGGRGIQLQLHRNPGGWGYRYHGGALVHNWVPSESVNPNIPEEWEIHTRDMFDDWGAFGLSGIAFTAWDGEHAIFDHVVFHQEEDDPLADLSVDPREKAAAVWAELKAR